MQILISNRSAIITAIVKSINKKKRLQMIEKDERDSTDFDRSISIGDDRCKLYFDSAKKRVMDKLLHRLLRAR